MKDRMMKRTHLFLIAALAAPGCASPAAKADAAKTVAELQVALTAADTIALACIRNAIGPCASKANVTTIARLGQEAYDAVKLADTMKGAAVQLAAAQAAIDRLTNATKGQ
jgi:hypothetical protein